MNPGDTPQAGAQRRWQAACPNCGAPVAFASAASAFAVCGFCRSTVVREGEALRRIGESAELFDDHSPVQLGTQGHYQGAGFTLVGRVQWRYAEGSWNEWHALFDSGKSGWLSEDNGRYVMGFEAPAEGAPTALSTLAVGAPLTVGGRRWSVASVQATQLQGLEGELPKAPVAASAWHVADLRNPQGEVGTLESPAEPGTAGSGVRYFVGQSVRLAELKLIGLRGDSEQQMQARSVECPSCGASLEVKLSSTRSIACHQCHAVVDVSGENGLGQALAHYAQTNGDEPLIPLGRVGQLRLGTSEALSWQVVGYVERCEISTPDASDDDEEDEGQSFWREYLLYNRLEGFAFLVDAEDGWSWAVPLTGTPEVASNGVRHQGHFYRKLYHYGGRITYVLGEFFWKLEQGQTTFNTDYTGTGAASGKRLNREETRQKTGAEVVWSVGEALDAQEVRRAFQIADSSAVRFQRDAQPTSLSTQSGLKWAGIVLGLVLLLLLLSRCHSSAREDCAPYARQFGESSPEYQQCLERNRRSGSTRMGGGSWGGYNSGGSHK